jgi:hypothetical protein
VESGANLANNILVGDADDKTVLGGSVLVLGLGDEALAGVVVGLTLAATTVLDLVAGKVRVGLLDLLECGRLALKV